MVLNTSCRSLKNEKRESGEEGCGSSQLVQNSIGREISVLESPRQVHWTVMHPSKIKKIVKLYNMIIKRRYKIFKVLVSISETSTKFKVAGSIIHSVEYNAYANIFHTYTEL